MTPHPKSNQMSLEVLQSKHSHCFMYLILINYVSVDCHLLLGMIGGRDMW